MPGEAHPWGDRERGTHAVFVEGIREGLRRAAAKITALNPPGDREPYVVPEHGRELRTAILVMSRSDVDVDVGTLANVHARFDVPAGPSSGPERRLFAVAGIGSGKTSLMLREAFERARRGDTVLIECVDGNNIHIMPASESVAILLKRLENIKTELDSLKEKYATLAGGLNIRGWWCICDIFNGEEKDPRTECRSCGRAKTVRAPRD